MFTYHMDLPLPVAMKTRQSRPCKIVSTISRWYGRNPVYPKYLCGQKKKPRIRMARLGA